MVKKQSAAAKREDVQKIKTFIEPIFETAAEIVKLRQRPLLVMFYSDSAGQIVETDMRLLEEVLEQAFAGERVPELDLIIYTRGGEVNASYRLAQLIRSYTQCLYTLIPFYAYSGGTVIALASNHIEMGRSSSISPIDVQVIGKEEKAFGLMSLEKYIELMKHACTETFKIKD